jgi:hypothetical protein
MQSVRVETFVIMQPVSANFDFLGTQGAQLVRLGASDCAYK